MNAQEHYQSGNLQEAIAAATAEVRQHPADSARRGLLCELLCFAGDLERADRQLEALGSLKPDALLGISLFRQLIRAEQARQEFYAAGHLPEFLEKPCARLRLHLEASIRIREGEVKQAALLLEQAENLRPRAAGTCDGQPFDDLRDLDDLTASFFEVLTSNGKYYWIPVERVELLELRKPERPRDLLWRRAHMVVRDGPDGEVFIPTLYAGSHAQADDRIRLGRMTEWLGGQGAPVRGIGQRTFLVGDEACTILELQHLTIDAPGPAEPA